MAVLKGYICSLSAELFAFAWLLLRRLHSFSEALEMATENGKQGSATGNVSCSELKRA